MKFYLMRHGQTDRNLEGRLQGRKNISMNRNGIKQIIEIAQKHNVPVIDNAPVARALFRMVDLNQQIPPELYKAVAEILLFVYGLKNKQNG